MNVNRGATLDAIGAFGSSRAASPLVEFVGRTKPPAALQGKRAGLAWASPVGISADLPDNEPLCSLVSHLGVGFVEVGPVALPDSSDFRRRFEGPRSHAAPIFVRLATPAGASAAEAAPEHVALVSELAHVAAAYTVSCGGDGWEEAERLEYLVAVVRAAGQAGRPVLAVVEPGYGGIDVIRSAGAAGIWIGNEGSDAPASVGDIARTRAQWPDALIVCGRGLVEPADAMAAFDAGADLVAFGRGLVESGPGLPKRINEALWHRTSASRSQPRRLIETLNMSWVALGLLGGALAMAGILAAYVALDRVLLAHDEVFLGMNQADLTAMNGRLLLFLAHDRMSLASTTLSIGILYVLLATQGMTSGATWARYAIVASAVPGFAAFLLYAQFGYFDVLDALGTLLMLCLFALGLSLPLVPPRPPAVPDLRNDRAWRLALWGQLSFVGLGIGFVAAGLTIATIGSTHVFVASDLEFLQTTSAALQAANERLLSVVAHDRARFGGGLVSIGVGILLTALWGIRRGARWVWWAFALSGWPGFVGGLGIHMAVGYLDVGHLALPVIAFLTYVVGLGLLWPYLCARPSPRPIARSLPARP